MAADVIRRNLERSTSWERDLGIQTPATFASRPRRCGTAMETPSTITAKVPTLSSIRHGVVRKGWAC